jgi:hypothetical protein
MEPSLYVVDWYLAEFRHKTVILYSNPAEEVLRQCSEIFRCLGLQYLPTPAYSIHYCGKLLRIKKFYKTSLCVQFSRKNHMYTEFICDNDQVF